MFGISIVIHIGLIRSAPLRKRCPRRRAASAGRRCRSRPRCRCDAAGSPRRRGSRRRRPRARRRPPSARSGRCGARAAVERDLGVEVLDLAAELHRQPVEGMSSSFAAPLRPGDDPAEARLAIEPERRDHADTGDDHASIRCCSQRHRRITSPTHRRRRAPHPSRTTSVRGEEANARATSSGSPRRPSGVESRIPWRSSSGSTPVSSVAM